MPFRPTTASLLALLLFALLCSTARAQTTYYVRATGNNSNNGLTPATAFRQVSRALTAAQAGDTVYVGAGSYTGLLNPPRSGTSGSPIRLHADVTGAFTGDAGTVTITGNDYAVYHSSRSHIQWTGFTFTSTDAGKDLVTVDGGTGVTFTSCTFSAGYDGLTLKNTPSVTVTSCTFLNNNDDGLDIDGGTAVVVLSTFDGAGSRAIGVDNGGASLTVNRCLFRNGAIGVETDGGPLTITNSVFRTLSNLAVNIRNSGSTGQIWNCTFRDLNAGVRLVSGAVVVRNSVFATISGAAMNRQNGTFTASNNRFFQVSGSISTNFKSADSETVVDPQFVGGSDYLIGPASPLINAGTSAATYTTIDFLGSPRPGNGGWDIGAHEADSLPPVFTNISASTSFNITSTTDKEHGGGLHWADYDNDGDLDVVITGSSARFLRRTGSTFASTTLGDRRRQAAVADFDSDGDVDVFIIADSSSNTEYYIENLGAGLFTSTGAAGMSAPSNNEFAAAADVDGDGRADLVMFSESGNHIGFAQPGSPASFVNSTDAAYGLHTSGNFGNGDYGTMGDVNSDGFPDFFYHFGGGRLFLSDGDGTYTRDERGISVVTGNSDKMGSSFADYDNDGDLDLFVCRFAAGQPGYLWRNNGSTFTNVAAAAGITNTGQQISCDWGDYDNDGDLDLIIVFATTDPALLYRNNDDGTFTSVQAGQELAGPAADVKFIDYDNDGDLDLSITRTTGGNLLLRNDTDDANYLLVRVLGSGPGGTNTAAVGTRVDLYDASGTTLLARRDVGGTSGHAGSRPLWLHFGGVNPASTYTVRVHFRTGIRSVQVVPQDASTTIESTTIDQMLTIDEADTTVRLIQWVEADPR